MGTSPNFVFCPFFYKSSMDTAYYDRVEKYKNDVHVALDLFWK